MQRIRKFIKIALIILIVAAVVLGLAVVTVNSYVVNKEKSYIVKAVKGADEDDAKLSSAQKKRLQELDPDCIMVLGCGIVDYNTPTRMLKDRLDVAIALYQQGVAPKILLTGDNGTVSHNEIHVMLTYTKKAGVPKKDIFCDHAGFSTYDSMYRARSIFQVKNMVVVTQSYHMYRSLYIARKLGLNALGVSADQKTYHGQSAREIREVLARDKDFLKCIRKPSSVLGGEAIPITGSGVSSHGE